MKVVRLVKKAKKGNKEALLQLIMEQQDDYYRLALTYMGNPHDAMDAMEEMVVSLYERIGQLKKDEAFYSWSKTILVNRCKQMLKKQNKVILVEEFNEEQDVAQNPYQQSEEQIDIRQMLGTLNKFQREAIQLKYFHDLDYETIANMTEVAVGTVKSRIFQGLKKLRDRFGGEFHD